MDIHIPSVQEVVAFYAGLGLLQQLGVTLGVWVLIGYVQFMLQLRNFYASPVNLLGWHCQSKYKVDTQQNRMHFLHDNECKTKADHVGNLVMHAMFGTAALAIYVCGVITYFAFVYLPPAAARMITPRSRRSS